jgi:hypothetical protein
MIMLGVLFSCWLAGESCSPSLMYHKSGVKNIENRQMLCARGNGTRHKTGTGNRLKLPPTPSVPPAPVILPPTPVPPLVPVQPPTTTPLQRTGGGCHDKGPFKKLSQQRISILEGVNYTFVLQVEFSEEELQSFLQDDASCLAKSGNIAVAAQTMAASSSASVASSLGMHDKEEQTIEMPTTAFDSSTTQSIVRFNNAPFNFLDILVQNLDKNAF